MTNDRHSAFRLDGPPMVLCRFALNEGATRDFGTAEAILVNNQISLGPMLSQEVSNLFIASARGPHQRSLPVFAPCIHIRTPCHEKLHGIEMCFRRCQHQCRASVFTLGIDVSSLIRSIFTTSMLPAEEPTSRQ
jgi:hypothetical protein